MTKKEKMGFNRSDIKGKAEFVFSQKVHFGISAEVTVLIRGFF